MRAVNLAEQTAYVVEGQTLKLSGEVTVHSIGQLFRKNRKLPNNQLREIDCSFITHADSSFFALMVFLQKHNSTPLTIVNMPEDLKSLMALYDLDGLLNII